MSVTLDDNNNNKIIIIIIIIIIITTDVLYSGINTTTLRWYLREEGKYPAVMTI